MAAINNALNLQQNATTGSLNKLTGMWDQASANMQPYMEGGAGGMKRLNAMAGGGFDYNTIRDNPMYQFQLDEGMRAGNRALSSKGLTDSSYGVNALADMGVRTAAGAQDNIWNKNYQLAGLGQNTASNQGVAGANYARGYGDLLTGMANAQASGILSNDAMNQQMGADRNSMYAGLAGGLVSNADKITGAADWLGDSTGWW